ncbi:hypothetical protein ACEWBY_00175 [Vibrio parahaemolyticus]
MGIEFEIRAKNARIYLRKAMHIGVIGTKITTEKIFLAAINFTKLIQKVV